MLPFHPFEAYLNSTVLYQAVPAITWTGAMCHLGHSLHRPASRNSSSSSISISSNCLSAIRFPVQAPPLRHQHTRDHSPAQASCCPLLINNNSNNNNNNNNNNSSSSSSSNSNSHH
ncbi:hypothetical protein EC988_007555 [Linderina pennispora]|nr:hypothetical protein EC988_007555 [Linderina pennispora]